MNDIWIGAEFHDPANGMFILGESTYGDDPPLSDYVLSWIRGEQTDSTFSRIFNAFSGAETPSATTAERNAFWASIAFGNFVQEAVGPTRKYRPSAADYRKASSSLPFVLRQLQPRGVIVLGIEQGKYSMPVIRAQRIPCVGSPHPTAWGVKTATLRTKWSELRQKRDA